MLEHLKPTPTAPTRVVVIGAGGFVGGAIVGHLKRDGVNLLALTRKELDLLDTSAASRLAGMLRADDSVVFVSALAPARNAATMLQNLHMADAVATAVAGNPVSHVIYISSDAVYADDANPVTERSCCHPSSFHGMMHAARELMLKSAVKAPLAILRPSLLYGARDPHNGYGPNRFRRLAEKGEDIALFGEGEELRDHVYIDDVATLAALVLRHRSRGVLNVATGTSVSFRETAQIILRLYGSRARIQGSPRQNPITHRHFDITSSMKAFPQFAFTPLAEGLSRTKAAAGAAAEQASA